VTIDGVPCGLVELDTIRAVRLPFVPESLKARLHVIESVQIEGIVNLAD
jgi:hypothetical protein